MVLVLLSKWMTNTLINRRNVIWKVTWMFPVWTYPQTMRLLIPRSCLQKRKCSLLGRRKRVQNSFKQFLCFNSSNLQLFVEFCIAKGFCNVCFSLQSLLTCLGTYKSEQSWSLSCASALPWNTTRPECFLSKYKNRRFTFFLISFPSHWKAGQRLHWIPKMRVHSTGFCTACKLSAFLSSVPWRDVVLPRQGWRNERCLLMQPPKRSCFSDGKCRRENARDQLCRHPCLFIFIKRKQNHWLLLLSCPCKVWFIFPGIQC